MNERPPWSELLQEQLIERRTLVVTGALDDRQAGDVAAQLMTLDATGDDPIQLYLDSVSASLEAAFVIMDTIDLLGVAVHATGLGTIEGPAVGVIAVAHRRRIARHARLHLCDPRVDFAGRAADLESWADHHSKQLHTFQVRLAEATGRPLEHIEADMRSGRYLDAEGAVVYGLVDEVLVPELRTDVARPKGLPFGFGPNR